ncbi:hypothetical protein HBI56_096810 [Parastagonospora nodorum]|uniref:Uncharacterized protein n=2 Tax=Phaeosphaeria nodorum (strain SN15 / ATCC MYA-4574 / FGSC 10173) TaxID=321614 RepID=A0A7U2F461_PHANO|nr:hypothetical protein SNOG_04430 [Parastagonospora nodorum SN15]KAH3914659.1 hypothetical protein HBH56_092180 [Parastagonospora nodorum]EAT88190.1 hypothetical protein SNOG_04430 [Parastagonospora nodorum SN15]KAH3936691.1 hypothetical protein HBH54_026830 [Parastagonospora nodorum]KAH3940489.1 hypothetical protein HBH53_216920 [Parastagonospora nodorum]KAH3957655.1 hypothetical protein HBH51_221720 [Parastagonospora nodorum]
MAQTSPLPLGPFRGGLAEPAYTQHEETDTGQTNARSVPVQAGEQHTHCAIIRRRIQTGLPGECPSAVVLPRRREMLEPCLLPIFSRLRKLS